MYKNENELFLNLMVNLGLRDLTNQKGNIDLSSQDLTITELILGNFEGTLNLKRNNNSNLNLDNNFPSPILSSEMLFILLFL